MSDGNGERRGAEPAVWWREIRYPYFVASRTLSITGDMAAVAAITVHIYTITGSGAAVAAFFVVRMLPRVLAPFAGVLGDRVELRRLLVLCDVVCAAVFLTIAAIGPPYVLLLCLVFVAESAATIKLPATRTMIGRTVPAEKLTAANGLVMAITSMGFAGGAALGALAAASWDYRWALAGNALALAVSAGLLSRLRRAEPEPRPVGQTFFTETRAGMAAIRGNPVLPPVVIGLIAVAFAASIDRVALVVIIVEHLRAPTVWYGIALGAISVGVLAASLTATRWRRIDQGSDAFFRFGLFAQAAGHLTMGLAPAPPVLLAGGLAAGVGNGLESVCGTTLLQRLVDKRSLGVIMGVVLSWSFLASAIGSQIGGTLVDLVGARWTFGVAAAIMAGCAVYAWLRRPSKIAEGGTENSTGTSTENSPEARASSHSGTRDERE